MVVDAYQATVGEAAQGQGDNYDAGKSESYAFSNGKVLHYIRFRR
jgi:hypothetical protein